MFLNCGIMLKGDCYTDGERTLYVLHAKHTTSYKLFNGTSEYSHTFRSSGRRPLYVVLIAVAGRRPLAMWC